MRKAAILLSLWWGLSAVLRIKVACCLLRWSELWAVWQWLENSALEEHLSWHVRQKSMLWFDGRCESSLATPTSRLDVLPLK